MKLHYKTYGSGLPLIIMHGLFGSGDNWRTIARMLEPDVESIVVDMRNHGRSPHDPAMNFRVMADDLEELMTDLGLNKATLLGHSMGGKVAMEFALGRHDMVDKMIIVDIAPKSYPPHHELVIEAIEAVHPEKITDRSEAEAILHGVLGYDPSTVLFLMKNLSRRPEGGFEWKANMPVIIEAYRHLMEDVDVMMPFYDPALFIRGENSRYILDDDFPRIRELFPLSRLVTIPGAGHWVHADAPEPFVREVRHFLSESTGH